MREALGALATLVLMCGCTSAPKRLAVTVEPVAVSGPIKNEKPLSETTGWVAASALSPDGKLLALAGEWGQLYLVDAERAASGPRIETAFPTFYFHRLEWTPDSKRLVAWTQGRRMLPGDSRYEATLWVVDAASGKIERSVSTDLEPEEAKEHESRHYGNDPVRLSLSKDGKRALLVYSQPVRRCLEVDTGRERAAAELEKPTPGTFAVEVEHRDPYHPQDRLVVTDAGTGEVVARTDWFEGAIDAAACRLLDRRRALLRESGDELVLLALPSLVEIARIERPHAQRWATLLVSRDERYAATATEERIFVVDLETKKTVLDLEGAFSISRESPLFSPDEKIAIARKGTEPLLVADLATGEVVKLPRQVYALSPKAFLGDGKWLLTVADAPPTVEDDVVMAGFVGVGVQRRRPKSEDEWALRIWDARTGDEVASFHEPFRAWVHLSADEKRLVWIRRPDERVFVAKVPALPLH